MMSLEFIKIEHLTHIFKSNDEQKKDLKALDDINLSINKGEFIAIIGVNGSGKSTLAKHLNGLLLPTEGACFVDGIKVEDSEEIWKIRQKVSMVFQNPDNQIIATIVEDDIAFGPENMGLPREEIRERVEFALKSLHIEHLRKFAPHLLSGGQKQLTAIAGAIAMRTNCLVLDEPTAMLDPQGRIAVMKALKELHEKYNMTIIMVTHFMEEAMQTQRIIVMDDGKVIRDGTPKQIFEDKKKLKALGLEVPLSVDIADELRHRGVKISDDVFTAEQLAVELEKVVSCR
ncbi:energy-coupling factor transporter ATPase [Megamonas hypermegale]|nr:energy-coupling factor transporter ATPase [Megamonas hypermegale]